MAGDVPTEFQADLSLKDFEIDNGTGFKYKFKWRPLNWYDQEKVINEVMNINSVTRQVAVNTAELGLRVMIASLKEAPFEITPENLKKLKSEIKDKILNIVMPKQITEETEKKLPGQ